MRGFRYFLNEQLQDPKVKREYDALEAEYSAKQAILCNAEAALKKTLEYKGYIGTIEYSEEDAAFFGKVTGIQALLSYEGCDETSLVADFHNVIDEYLEMCRERGLVPEDTKSVVMGKFEEIAQQAEIIVNGYAFICEEEKIRVINLNDLSRTLVMDANGKVLESSMHDIEIGIVQTYWEKNKEFVEGC